MLIKFTVDNFRSIDKEITLDLSASNAIKDLENKGYTASQDGKFLNSIAFYGANSSGKTNLLKAIKSMRSIVLHSVRLNDNEPLPYEPFLLSTKEGRPTKLEVTFIIQEERSLFRYGFLFNETEIIEEWLDAKFPRRSEKQLFRRSYQQIFPDEVNFPESSKYKDATLNKNRLYISLMGQLGGEISNKIIEWFRTKIFVLSGIDDSNYYRNTRTKVFDDPAFKERVATMMRELNFGFNGIEVEKKDMSNMTFPQAFPAELVARLKSETIIEVSTVHNVYDADGKVIKTELLDLDENESAGTNKFFNLAGPICDALEHGTALCIDELDSQMHPLISWKIVEMFNDPTTNQTGAQLIFSTHDTHLLSKELFRRDQIWFVEKMPNSESTDIYPMLQAKHNLSHAPRTDSNYQKNYIKGRYGAIPFLTNASPIEEDSNTQ